MRPSVSSILIRKSQTLSKKSPLPDSTPNSFGIWPGDDRQRQADDETLEHGLGDEVRDEAEPQETGDQRGEPNDDGERSRRRDELASVTRDGVPDDRGRKSRGGRGWPDDQLARTAEGRVENQRGRHRVETDDG